MLGADMRELIRATELFHARLKRLDNGWREREPGAPSAITRLRERLAQQAVRTH